MLRGLFELIHYNYYLEIPLTEVLSMPLFRNLWMQTLCIAFLGEVHVFTGSC